VVGAQATATDSIVPPDKQIEIRIGLHHSILPELADVGYLTYDPEIVDEIISYLQSEYGANKDAP